MGLDGQWAAWAKAGPATNVVSAAMTMITRFFGLFSNLEDVSLFAVFAVNAKRRPWYSMVSSPLTLLCGLRQWGTVPEPAGPPMHFSAIISPIGIADVAAGEGALHTWSIRSV